MAVSVTTFRICEASARATLSYRSRFGLPWDFQTSTFPSERNLDGSQPPRVCKEKWVSGTPP